jgi:hypothetical protein
MSARSDFDDTRIKLPLKALYHIFPSGKPSAIRAAITPNIIIIFINTDNTEIAVLFKRSVALNVVAVVVDDVNIRSFHVISFLDD